MSDSEDSNFSEEESEQSSEPEDAEENEHDAEEERVSPAGSEKGDEEEADENDDDADEAVEVDEAEERDKPEEGDEGSEEAEEEDDYDEEEDDDNDRPRKKSRHGGRFILDEADVDDEYDDDEDQWDGETEQIIGKEEIEASNIDNAMVNEDRSGARRLQNVWRDQREEDLAEYYRKKYAKSSVGEQDPNLWTVKCRIGEERLTFSSLMRMLIAYEFMDRKRRVPPLFAEFA